MKISLIGTGNVGRRLGKLFANSGHEVYFGSREPQKAQAVATATGLDMRVGTYAEAAHWGNLVVIATPWAHNATADALREAGALTDKVVIDCTNPLAPDYMSNTIGHTTSSAEEIAKMIPQARVVKAFNTIFAAIMEQGKQKFGSETATGFYCGDDAEAKQAVAGLIEDAGFEPIDVGALKNARYLEAMAQLNIQVAYGLSGGTDVAFKYMRR